jgi:formylglycine-generating enzyme required for sulfatase activity
MAIIGFALREPLRVGLKIEADIQAATGPVVEIPAAEALLGSAISPAPLALPEGGYQLEAFAIEPYEVTNGRYLLCVESGPCTAPGGLPSDYQSEDRKDYPVTHVTAIQAMHFCQWIGRTLPTDEQWERAARGTNGREWPWGSDPPTPERANVNFNAENGAVQMVGVTQAGTTAEGIYDLVGNVMEWTRSAYELDETGWNGLPDSPPVSLSARGGSYVFSAVDIVLRTPIDPTASEAFVGFRCVETR